MVLLIVAFVLLLVGTVLALRLDRFAAHKKFDSLRVYSCEHSCFAWVFLRLMMCACTDTKCLLEGHAASVTKSWQLMA